MAALLTSALALALVASQASAQPPVPGSPTVIDGPSGAIENPAGLGVSIARDGTGGLVYLKAVGGTAHVFVSRLVGGSFRSPVQVDSALAGSSSQPVIAAGNGGLLLVGFVNGGQLYVVDGNAQGQFGSPIPLAGGVSNPAISISNFGKAYLAFTVADGAGYAVRSAYYDNGQWALETPPLNANGADDAGTGAGRPEVAAAGDGIAIVVWGESGHIYSRRVWGTAPSVVDEQADAPLSGCTESSVGDPVLGAGGDSSYAPVAFTENMFCGGRKQSRVLMNRLQGSVYDGVTEVDGLSASSIDGADDPQIAVAEYGVGWVTSEGADSDDVFAAGLTTDGAFTGVVTQVNTLPAAAAPYPVPAITGYNTSLIAWQQEPGAAPGGEIRFRFEPSGGPLGPETVLSSPAQGPVDAADGISAAGDISGEAAIAWLQGAPGGTQVMVGQLYQPPGGFSPQKTFAYARTTQPILAWTRPTGWGPITYSLSIDGAQVGQTYSNSAQAPAPLANGPNVWQATATNPAGQQSRTPAAIVFIDTVPPVTSLRLPARTLVGKSVRAVIRYSDPPPPGEPRYDASGVATVVIRWGDGTVVHLKIGTHFLRHVYRRPGRYRIMLVVTDRAGNVSRLVRFVRVVKSHGHVAGKQ